MAVAYNLKNILTEMTGIKFVETLKITFEKQSGDETVYKTAYFNSFPQTILNETEITPVLPCNYTTNIKPSQSMDIRGIVMDDKFS